MFNLKKVLALTALLLVSSAALAEDNGGFYAGLGALEIKAKNFCNGASNCDDTDTKWNAFGGYRFNENFAAEATYLDLGSFSMGPLNGDANSWELSGLAILPIGSFFKSYPMELYARAGLARVKVNTNFSSSDTNDAEAVWGVGLNLPITDKIGARLDYRAYNGIGDSKTTGQYDLNVFELAATYKF